MAFDGYGVSGGDCAFDFKSQIEYFLMEKIIKEYKYEPGPHNSPGYINIGLNIEEGNMNALSGYTIYENKEVFDEIIVLLEKYKERIHSSNRKYVNRIIKNVNKFLNERLKDIDPSDFVFSKD